MGEDGSKRGGSGKEGLKRLGLGHDFSRTEILKALRDPNNIPPKDMEPEKPKKSYLYSFKSTFLTVDGYLNVITINKTNPAKK